MNEEITLSGKCVRIGKKEGNFMRTIKEDKQVLISNFNKRKMIDPIESEVYGYHKSEGEDFITDNNEITINLRRIHQPMSKNESGYYQCLCGCKKSFHQLYMEALGKYTDEDQSRNNVIDHINQDKCDNRAINLRTVDVWANRCNQTRQNEKRKRQRLT